MSDNTFKLIVLGIMIMLTFVAIVYIMIKNYKDERIGTTCEGAINEQKKIKERKERVPKNKSYYCIRIKVEQETEEMTPVDDMNYEDGNYFYTFCEAHDTLEKIIKQLKNR